MFNQKLEQPTVLPIKKIIPETKDFYTFVFEYDLQAKPGQFLMIWIPGIDAKPIAVAHQTKTEFHIAVFAIGPFTKRLCQMKAGDKVGFFGPYGKPFSLHGNHIALIGGGSGTPPLKWLAYEAQKEKIKVDFIWGARNQDYLPYLKELEQADFRTYHSTDDGSSGTKGFTTDVLKSLLTKQKYDYFYTCGPEIMMKKIIDISNIHDIPCQVSMERYMKCGFGICGQCSVDGLGVPLCTQGPIFEKEKIREIKEFAAYNRDAKGEKHYTGTVDTSRRD